MACFQVNFLNCERNLFCLIWYIHTNITHRCTQNCCPFHQNRILDVLDAFDNVFNFKITNACKKNGAYAYSYEL
jgi:hypothetical protein